MNIILIDLHQGNTFQNSIFKVILGLLMNKNIKNSKIDCNSYFKPHIFLVFSLVTNKFKK